MDVRCRVEMLGGLRVLQDGRTITRFRAQKFGALLAYLACHRDQAQPREVLMELLWPEMEPAAGRNNLRVALSSLRRQLEPPGVPHGTVLAADRWTVRLDPASVTTDVAEFAEMLERADRAAERSEQAERLEAAVGLFRGEFLPGFYDDWIIAEQSRLTGRFFTAATRLVRLYEQNGDAARAHPIARRAVAMDPLREVAHRDLIRVLAAAGDEAAALHHFREAERLLKEGLGADPSPGLRAFARDLERRAGASAVVPLPSVTPVSPVFPVPSPPSGTVTFLLTDIEGSTAVYERAGSAFETALERHHALLRQEFARHGGHAFKETGDGFLVAFAGAGDALACAVACQRTLTGVAWPDEIGGALRVRMALHTGEVEVEKNDYHGLVLHRASRVLTAGHGGQILCSEATAALLRRETGEGVWLTDLGIYRLRDVLGVERLFQVEFPGMTQGEFGPLRAEAGFAGNLPPTMTRFFGREQEIARIGELLREAGARLLTLTGTGGTGKTRLALEVAGRLVEAFGGAVWFAPMADIADPRLIAGAVRDALRLPRSQGMEPLDQVASALAAYRSPSLLVLDNFEQVVDGGAEIVQTLLARVPGLTCLVTSRRRLLLSGEREFPVPPLPTPDGGEDTPERLDTLASVQMFVDRAQAVRPDFQVTRANASAIAELMRRLEGIPLALELAASRAQVLTPGQMLAQIDHRFDLLATRRRDIPERHRTLRTTMDWSVRLLPEPLQRFFGRLSVFRGGWTAEAAEVVCEEPRALDCLAELRECSLLQAEESGPQMRFRMLETLREYAGDQLTAEERIHAARRHTEYYLALAEAAVPWLRGPEQALWLARLETEHDNLRAALGRNLADDEGAEAGLRMAGALWRFWNVHSHFQEGRAWISAVLARTGAQERTSVRTDALNGAGLLAYYQGDLAQAEMIFAEALSIQRELADPTRTANVLNNIANVARERGDHEAARALYEEALAINRRLGNQTLEALNLNNLGIVALCQGDFASARDLCGQALAIRRGVDDPWFLSHSLGDLGMALYRLGDRAAARTLLEESLALRRVLQDQWGVALVLNNLGWLAYDEGDLAASHTFGSESLRLRREMGDSRGVADCLHLLARIAGNQHDSPAARRAFLAEGLDIYHRTGHKGKVAHFLYEFADLAAAQGQAKRAARLWGGAEALREAIHAPGPDTNRPDYEHAVGAARTALGEKAFEAGWSSGRSMTPEQAVAYALGEDGT